MCQFFSCISDGEGKVYYFNAEIRKRIIAGELPYGETDSHSVIATYYFPETNGGAEDGMNKYEYNPLTKRFQIDQLNTMDDSKVVEEFCRALDFSTVVPELVTKEVVHPFKDRDGQFTEEVLGLLKEWASVWASVRASVWDSVSASVRASVWDSVRASVWDSVRASVWASVRASVWASVRASVWDSVSASVRASVWDSVRASVWDSVRASVWASVRASVWASVRASVWDSVWASVWDSVWDSVGAYISSFFTLPSWKRFEHLGEYVNPFQPAIDLWEMGLVPSFDGERWRLHAKSGIVWEGTLE